MSFNFFVPQENHFSEKILGLKNQYCNYCDNEKSTVDIALATFLLRCSRE